MSAISKRFSYDKDVERTLEFIDTIDLLAEMTEVTENVNDFMDRLSEKYSLPTGEPLLDDVNTDEFYEYLTYRYSNKDCRMTMKTITTYTVSKYTDPDH